MVFVLAIEVCRLRGLCLGKGFKETAWHLLPSIAISHETSHSKNTLFWYTALTQHRASTYIEMLRTEYSPDFRI